MTGGTVESVVIVPVPVTGGGEVASVGAGTVTSVVTDPGHEGSAAVGAIKSKTFPTLVADGAVIQVFTRGVTANFGVCGVRPYRPSFNGLKR